MSQLMDLMPTLSALLSVGAVAAAMALALLGRATRSRNLRRRIASAVAGRNAGYQAPG